MKKQTFTHLTDVEVIEKYKNNPHWSTRKDIEEYFYTKFRSIIGAQSRKFEKISSYEDNLQESYFIMLKALEWVDVNKITNVENYSFGSTLNYVLNAYFNNEIRYESPKAVIEKAMISIYQETDGNTFIIENECESHEEKIVFTSTIQQFKNMLKDGERKIWDLLELGYTQKEIAVQYGKVSVQYPIQKLKAKYVDFMNNNGYSIQF